MKLPAGLLQPFNKTPQAPVEKPKLVVVPKPEAAGNLKPLCKWIGSKRRLAPDILARVPCFTGTYWEPMCGGASVFCALSNTGLLKGRDVVLADINEHLISLLELVKKDPARLVLGVQYYRVAYNYSCKTDEDRSKLFYETRKDWNFGDCAPEVFLFLKATAFNGLWRVNNKGEHNAPWGKYKSAKLVTEETILAWHEALQGVTLKTGSVLDTCKPKKGDLVYLDPPYMGTFDKYHMSNFGPNTHEALLKLAAQWVKAGVHVVYSNSVDAEPSVDKLWPTGVKHRLTTRYMVNRNGAGRKPVEELLVVQ